jgi:hypothetical protein
MKQIKDSHTGKMRDMDGYDKNFDEGDILGPFPLP